MILSWHDRTTHIKLTMKNLTRNVWICLGLLMLPLAMSAQQKKNFT